MIGALGCDICGDTIKGIQRLGQLGPDLSTPGKFEHMCPSCKYKIDNEIEKIRDNANKNVVAEIKSFIEKLHENPKIAKGPKKEA